MAYGWRFRFLSAMRKWKKSKKKKRREKSFSYVRSFGRVCYSIVARKFGPIACCFSTFMKAHTPWNVWRSVTLKMKKKNEKNFLHYFCALRIASRMLNVNVDVIGINMNRRFNEKQNTQILHSAWPLIVFRREYFKKIKNDSPFHMRSISLFHDLRSFSAPFPKPDAKS